MALTIKHRVSLDLSLNSIQATVPFYKGDVAAHEVIFGIRNGSEVVELPVGTIANINIYNGANDGAGVADMCTVDHVNNTISYYPTKPALSVSGNVTCELWITDAGGASLGAKVIFLITESMADVTEEEINKALQGSSALGLIQNVEQNARNAEKFKEDAESSEANAAASAEEAASSASSAQSSEANAAASAEEAASSASSAESSEANASESAKAAANSASSAEKSARNAASSANTLAKYVDDELKPLKAFLNDANIGTENSPVIDTLLEIQEYIKNDEDGASAMAASIKANKDNIDEVQKNIESQTYTNTSKPMQSVGGITPSTFANGFNNIKFADVMKAMFYPYTKPEISEMSLDPPAGVKEKGKSIEVKQVSAKITKKSEDIAKVELYRDSYISSNIISTKTENCTGTVEFSVEEYLTGTANTKFTIRATDTEGGYGEISATYTFVNPYYFVVLESGTTITGDNLKPGKSVQSKGTKTHKYTTAANEFPVIAYPKSYGALSSIKDANGFAQTWEQTEIDVDGVAYYVYSGEPAEARDFTYVFTHNN